MKAVSLMLTRSKIVKIAALAVVLLLAGLVILRVLDNVSDPRSRAFRQWGRGNPEERQALITSQEEACSDAPFILPAEGYIGLLYGDPRGPYSRVRPHQGIDIFTDAEPGLAPVFAAYDGYVTREHGWRSSLILRVPEDPFDPERQIWLYYTHMADEEGNDFIVEAIPEGTREYFVRQGALLGYTGNYNGDSARTIWVHLHFSIVKDDGKGRYTNELEFDNTIDPSPYLGMGVRYGCPPDSADCAVPAPCV
jgi:murein DD-endopeptidase MepM/ murein hydrolase activator NlpD